MIPLCLTVLLFALARKAIPACGSSLPPMEDTAVLFRAGKAKKDSGRSNGLSSSSRKELPDAEFEFRSWTAFPMDEGPDQTTAMKAGSCCYCYCSKMRNCWRHLRRDHSRKCSEVF